MFGIGTSEVLIILLIALLVLGPSKLPEIARALGKGLAEFRKMSSDVKRELDLEVQLAEMEERTKKTKNLQDEMEGEEQKQESKEDKKDIQDK